MQPRVSTELKPTRAGIDRQATSRTDLNRRVRWRFSIGPDCRPRSGSSRTLETWPRMSMPAQVVCLLLGDPGSLAKTRLARGSDSRFAGDRWY